MRRIGINRLEMAWISGAALVLVAAAVAIGGAALALAPVALLALLLTRGVFVGEELIALGRARLAGRCRRRPEAPALAPCTRVLPIRQRLIALSLASRGPPVPA